MKTCLLCGKLPASDGWDICSFCEAEEHMRNAAQATFEKKLHEEPLDLVCQAPQ